MVLMKKVLVFFFLISFSGCTWGNYGTLATKTTYTETAMIVDVYSVGMQVRPQSMDGGASLGNRHAVYIYPCPKGNQNHTDSGWSFFKVTLPEKDPVARVNSTYGLDFEAAPDLTRFSLGYSDQIITNGPKPGESRIVKLDFDRKNIKLTDVSVKEGLYDPEQSSCF